MDLRSSQLGSVWRLISVPVLWTAFCLAVVVGLSLFWGDGVLGITAAVTGVLYTILAGYGKRACFFFGLVNTPIYAYLSYGQAYYGDFILNIYYFIMMFPGLWTWSRHPSADRAKGIERTRLTARERLLWGLGCGVAILGLWFLLRQIGGNRPFCDALTNVFSVTAMMLTVKRAIEQWYLWIAVNTIEVVMWFAVWQESGAHVSVLIMWLLFLVNGLYMFRQWKKAEN